VDNNTNFAAWMIGGGLANVDPEEARSRIHRQALADAKRDTPGVVARFAAAAAAFLQPATATIGAYRSAPAPSEPDCCAA
jgi:hypothetical protein